MRALRVILILTIVFGTTAASLYAQDSENAAKGFAADKVFQFNDLDHINLFNGGLNIVTPIGQSFKTDGSLAYQLSLGYANDQWETESIIDEGTIDGVPYTNVYNYYVPDASDSVSKWNAGFGWRLSLGALEGGDGCDTCWAFTSPDGAKHGFSREVHIGVDHTRATGHVGSDYPHDPWYTSDNSYLRMHLTDDNLYREVETPEGLIYRFPPTGGLPIQIRDRFNNQVNVAYTSGNIYGSTTWTITDAYRTITVMFEKITVSLNAHDPGTSDYPEPTSYDVVKSVTFPTASGTAVYTFHYGDSPESDSPSWISRRLDTSSQDCHLGPTVSVPLLTSVTLPDSSTFQMTYDRGDATNMSTPYGTGTPSVVATHCTESPNILNAIGPTHSGNLTALKLPTAGTIQWQYKMLTFPPDAPGLGSPGLTGVGHFGGDRLIHPIGVVNRFELDASNNVLSKKNYNYAFYEDGGGSLTSHTAITRVRTFSGPFDGSADYGGTVFSKTLQYSSVGPNGVYTLQGEYSLPFTKYTPPTPTDPENMTPNIPNTLDSGTAVPVVDPTDPTRFLSSKLYDASNKLVQYSYVGYECDDRICSAGQLGNRRERSSRTVYRNAAGTADIHSVATVRSDFDGLGHYRTTVTSSDLPGSGTRTTTTAYNKSDGLVNSTNTPNVGTYVGTSVTPAASFTLPVSSAPWVLSTYTSQSATEQLPSPPYLSAPAASTVKSLFCFDGATGFLNRSRIFANGATPAANDLVSRHTPDSAGNMTLQESFGGDTQAVGTGSALCDITLPSAKYSIASTYMNGALHTSGYQFSGSVPVYSKDIDVTAATGLVSVARDTAGIRTAFTYDEMSRVIDAKPVDSGGSVIGGWTHYAYTNAVGTTPAEVLIQRKAIDGTTLAQQKYHYDALGRVIEEMQLMPSGSWSIRKTVYNEFGFKTQVSEQETTPSHFTVFSNFDALGRAGTVTAPDSSVVSISYAGVGSMTRSSYVAATAGGSETQFATTETYDGQHRLMSVTELSGPTSSSTTAGQPVITQYTYDVGDRLTSVKMTGASADNTVQQRYFLYDARGFLTVEAHPENGITRYGSYDAKGHVGTKTVGDAGDIFDQFMTYDAAERLVEIDERDPYNLGQTRPFKVFVFANANVGTSLVAGKLNQAIRYNYSPYASRTSYPPNAGKFKVVETYAYKDALGRKTERQTDIVDLDPPYPPYLPPSMTVRSIMQEVTYNDLDLLSETDYPTCANCGVPPSPTTITPSYTAGRLTALPGFVSGITYHPSGLVNAITHTNGIVDTTTPDANGMARPLSIAFGSYSDCAPPTIATAPAASVSSLGGGSYSVTLSVTASGSPSLQYQWYEVSSDGWTRTAVSGATSATSTFTTSATGSKYYEVDITTACRSITSDIATATFTSCAPPEIVSVYVDWLVGYNQTAKLAVKVKGTGPFTYQWYRRVGVTDTPISTAATYTFSATSAASYWVRVYSSCGNVDSSVNGMIISLPAPSSLSATAVDVSPSPITSVLLTWTGSNGVVDHYVIQRRTAGAVFSTLTTIAATSPLASMSYTDSGCAAGKSYVYRIYAMNAASDGASASPYANYDAATTMSLPHVNAGDVVSEAPLETILTAINSLRAADGDGPVTWSGILPTGVPTPVSNGPILAAYTTALRAQLGNALTMLGVGTLPHFTDADLTLGVSPKKEHINEMMDLAK